MPTSPAKPCKAPHCPNKVKGRAYCPDHERDYEGENRWSYSENDPFYHSRKWRKVSKKYRKLNPTCEKCGKAPMSISKLDVDHKTPIEQGGHKYSFDNLQSLCKSCHAKKTKKER